MPAKKINFAIVGFGNIGKRHARHIMANADAELVAVCETDPENANLAELPDSVAVYNTLDIMLSENSLDVVNVCTPNHLHRSMTVAALEAGYNVVVEKPMALSASDCLAMIEAAEIANREMFVVKQNRYNPPVKEVRKLILQGLLGKIQQVNINCFWNRNAEYYQRSPWRGKRELDGGCLFTQFSHFVDVMYYLFGDVETRSGRIENFGHKGLVEFEDSGTFLLNTTSGAIASFSFSTCTYGKNMEGSITVIGEKGTVKIGGEYLNTIEYQHVKGYTIPELNGSSGANDYGSYQGSMSNHDKVIQNVVDTLNGTDVVKTTGTEGMKVVEIIERMYQSCTDVNSVR